MTLREAYEKYCDKVDVIFVYLSGEQEMYKYSDLGYDYDSYKVTRIEIVDGKTLILFIIKDKNKTSDKYEKLIAKTDEMRKDLIELLKKWVKENCNSHRCVNCIFNNNEDGGIGCSHYLIRSSVLDAFDDAVTEATTVKPID